MVCQMTDIPPTVSNDANRNIVDPDHSSRSTKSGKMLDNSINPTLSEDELRLNRLGYKQVQYLVICLHHKRAMIIPYEATHFHSLSESEISLQTECRTLEHILTFIYGLKNTGGEEDLRTLVKLRFGGKYDQRYPGCHSSLYILSRYWW